MREGRPNFFRETCSTHFQRLAEQGYQSILVEAGGNLIGQLLDAGLVDEWISYHAPIVTGGDVVAVGGTGTTNLEERPRLKNISYQKLGADIRMKGLVVRTASL